MMEHGASARGKEPSQMEMSIKTEVGAATSTSYIDSEMPRRKYTVDSEAMPGFQEFVHFVVDYAEESESEGEVFGCMSSEEDKLLQVLCSDWTLECRGGVWAAAGRAGGDRVAPPEQLAGFQRDLNLLRRLSQDATWAVARVFLQSALLRAMAGAAPAQTQQLLHGSLRARHSRTSIICGKDRSISDEDGAGARGAALYAACRHLPTALVASPGQRSGMLVQAAKTLERIGHRRKLNDCYQLMKRVGTSSASL